jgi:hypothetical protein
MIIKTYQKTFVPLINVLLKEMNLVVMNNRLYYRKYIGQGIYNTFEISQDELDVFRILKLDWKVYYNGFNSLEEMFDYVISSSFFNKWLYKTTPKELKGKLIKYNFQLFRDYLQRRDVRKTYVFINNEIFYHKYVRSIVEECNVALKARAYPKLLARRAVERRSFNGHVILRSMPKEFKPGPLLGEYMKYYKDFITQTTKEPFYKLTLTVQHKFLMEDFKRVALNRLPF